MATKLEELAVELLGLSASDRALLAKQLILSLDERQTESSQDLWIAEARRRAREIDAGSAETLPAEEVLARARKQLS
jgi:putative addiction module component (TIGR02574 family)